MRRRIFSRIAVSAGVKTKFAAGVLAATVVTPLSPPPPPPHELLVTLLLVVVILKAGIVSVALWPRISVTII